MTQENSLCAPCVQVIVVANEKGGSGKSTVAVHLAVALMKSGLSVASIDLDSRQRSFTHYIDNRLAWGRQRGKDLPTPAHLCFDEDAEFSTAQDASAARQELAQTIENLTSQHRYVVIDTAGHNHFLTQFAHSRADVLVTPLNDSFIDLDVLGNVDPETFRHYRHQPLCPNRRGCETPAPDRGKTGYRLDRAAEPAFDAGLTE